MRYKSITPPLYRAVETNRVKGHRLTILAASILSLVWSGAQAETVNSVDFSQAYPSVEYQEDTTVTGLFKFTGGNDHALNASVTVNEGQGTLTFTSAESFSWRQGGKIAINASSTTFTGTAASRYDYTLTKDSAQGTLTFSGNLIFTDLTSGAAIRGNDTSKVSDIVAAGDIFFSNVSTYEQVASMQAVSLIGRNITADNVHQTGYDMMGTAFWVHKGVLQTTGGDSQDGLISVRNSSFEHGSYGSAALWADNAGQILADQIVVDEVQFASASNRDKKNFVASGIHAENGSHVVATNSIEIKNIDASTIQAAGLHLEGKSNIGGITPPGGYPIESDPATLLKTSEITIKNITSKTEGLNAFGVYAVGDDEQSEGLKLSADRLTVEEINGTFAYGFAQMLDGVSEFGVAEISKVSAQSEAAGVYLRGMNASIIRFDDLQVHDVTASDAGFATLVDVGAGTVSANAATLKVQDAVEYAGNFSGNAESSQDTVRTVAIRSVRGGLADLSAEDGIYTIVGDVIAGYGTAIQEGAVLEDAGRIKIGGSSAQIYGDLYAGNGGVIELTLEGENSLLEGQIDDYHELAFTDAAFRNSLFRDDVGNALDVTQAGQVKLNLNGSTWIARGQNFVDTVSFGVDGGTIDLSRNENSSASIENLTGSGTFVMELGAYSESGDIKTDMLYIQNAEAGSQHVIHAKLGEGVSRDDLENIRFATVKNGAAENLFVVKVEDQGVFNLTATVEQENYQTGDADNVRFNGTGNGEGDYKPGEDVVDAIFGSEEVGASTPNASTLAETGDGTAQNYYISGFGGGADDGEISDAGQTILATARATYWNAVILDRWNQRYGERTYDENRSGVWARVKHERLGTDSGTGDFRSYNTMYQFGYDYAKPTENGKMIWGAAFDYMDGRTDYKSIEGDGGTDRTELSLYATYLGDNGFYGDLVIRGGKLNSDFDMVTPSGTALDADYDNWFYGVSFETGRQLENDTGWFVEPQAQMQYLRIASGDYSTAQTEVEQDAIDSLIGRAGFRVGKFLSDDKAQTVYFKADVLREFMGEQKIRVTDVTTRTGGEDVSISNHGTWFDVGAGFQAAVSKDFYAYGDVEYRFGNDLWNTWVFNLGAKYRF